MTSPLRRKRRTTAPGRSTPARTAAKALGLALLWAGAAWAGDAPRAERPPDATVALAPWKPGASTPSSYKAPAVPRTAAAEAPPASLAAGQPLPSPFRQVGAPAPAAPRPAVQQVGWTEPAAPQAAAKPPALVFDKEPGGPPPDVRKTAFQQPRPDRQPLPEETSGYQIKVELELPGPGRLFQLNSEAQFQERIRQEHRGRTPLERSTFPDPPVVSEDRFPGRFWPVTQKLVEPAYLCYGRLYFEEKNAERYGWDFGILQPALSAGTFFAQAATLPYRWLTNPCRGYECNAGYCLPGDPVPYLLYPPGASLTGGVGQAGAIIGAIAVFP